MNRINQFYEGNKKLIRKVIICLALVVALEPFVEPFVKIESYEEKEYKINDYVIINSLREEAYIKKIDFSRDNQYFCEGLYGEQLGWINENGITKIKK